VTQSFAVAANLSKVISSKGAMSSVTFALHAGSLPANQIPDEKTLSGFALLSIAQK